MWSSISLRKKFTFLACAIVIASLANGYRGYTAVDEMMTLSRLETVSSAIRHHMELDMMHDATNGDVLTAITALQNNDAAGVDKAIEDLKEHTATVAENFAELHALSFSPEVESALKTTEPQFHAYMKDAEALLATIASDVAHNSKNYLPQAEAFGASFEALEARMSNTSDVIQAWAAQIKKQGADIAANAHRELVIILIVSVLLALSMPILANINMFSALANLRNAARALAQEEYDAKIPYTHRQDEIGTLARTLEALRLKAVDAFRLKKMIDDMPLNVITADARDEFKINYANNATKKTLQLLQQHLPVAVADIEGKSIDIFHKDPGRIRRLLADPANLPHEAKIKIGEDIIDQKISAMFDKKGEYVGPMLTWEIVTKNIKLADDFESSVGAVSQQIAASAGTLQQRAATLESAIEELSAAALEISKRVHEALRIVQDAVSQGDSAAGHTTELSTSADKVTGVITLIRSIAEKTNLLALNATIESARAGEAGKGFAVVANEVKSLASQTATAITDITSQINEMQHSAAGTADAIKQMCAIITNVNKIATEIASTVEEQQAATAEIARNISGSSKGISSSTTMMGMATQLTEVSTDLSNRCDSFLEKVRKI